jgi:hypothetical protein
MTENQKSANTGNIPYDVLLDLHNLYLSKKHGLLSADLTTKEETKSVWFELDAGMRNFLKEVSSDPLVSGIRVYLMAYPEKQTIMHGVNIPVDPNDINQLTIGLVTTKAGDGTGRRHEDYPESKTGVKMLLAPPVNHGELCPQKCD